MRIKSMSEERKPGSNTAQDEVQESAEESQADIPTRGGRGRRGRRSSLSGLLPGLILILLGVLFLLNNAGRLPEDDWWQYFLVGLGVIFIIEAWVQYVNNRTGWPKFGRILAGLVLIGMVAARTHRSRRAVGA
jgi:hypothetical protein